ncbi:hypothetical protein D3C72_1484500 [compost metagenome]
MGHQPPDRVGRVDPDHAGGAPHRSAACRQALALDVRQAAAGLAGRAAGVALQQGRNPVVVPDACSHGGHRGRGGDGLAPLAGQARARPRPGRGRHADRLAASPLAAAAGPPSPGRAGRARQGPRPDGRAGPMDAGAGGGREDRNGDRPAAAGALAGAPGGAAAAAGGRRRARRAPSGRAAAAGDVDAGRGYAGVGGTNAAGSGR